MCNIQELSFSLHLMLGFQEILTANISTFKIKKALTVDQTFSILGKMVYQSVI